MGVVNVPCALPVRGSSCIAKPPADIPATRIGVSDLFGRAVVTEINRNQVFQIMLGRQKERRVPGLKIKCPEHARNIVLCAGPPIEKGPAFLIRQPCAVEIHVIERALFREARLSLD